MIWTLQKHLEILPELVCYKHLEMGDPNWFVTRTWKSDQNLFVAKTWKSDPNWLVTNIWDWFVYKWPSQGVRVMRKRHEFQENVEFWYCAWNLTAMRRYWISEILFAGCSLVSTIYSIYTRLYGNICPNCLKGPHNLAEGGKRVTLTPRPFDVIKVKTLILIPILAGFLRLNTFNTFPPKLRDGGHCGSTTVMSLYSNGTN
jgi:hypothetical protein